jgi:hypothetical protein
MSRALTIVVVTVFCILGCDSSSSVNPDAGPDAADASADKPFDISSSEPTSDASTDGAGTSEGRACEVSPITCAKNNLDESARFCPPDGGSNRVLWTCLTSGLDDPSCALAADCQRVFFSSGNNPHFCCSQ